MFKKEIEEHQIKLSDAVDEQDKIRKHIDSLEAIDKYLTITEFKNNLITEGKQIEFEDAINGKTIVIAFRVNGEEKQFRFCFGRHEYAHLGLDNQIRERFSKEFAHYIYKQLQL